MDELWTAYEENRVLLEHLHAENVRLLAEVERLHALREGRPDALASGAEETAMNELAHALGAVQLEMEKNQEVAQSLMERLTIAHASGS